ncbi:hypothetical protein VTP01DRAFT_6789 [Rhizomucor pusillus]|uniref:uncharacterized protein n=1 Tax=Rhizomucor pusillus TaxID=4840 RepID=UPI0037431F9A
MSRVSHGSIARLGGWIYGNNIIKCYATNVPPDVMLASAGYSKELGSYYHPRSHLEVPQSLIKQIFPQLNEYDSNTIFPSMASSSFAALLVWLRKILLQGMLFFKQAYSTLRIVHEPIWNSLEYQQYASLSIAKMRILEREDPTLQTSETLSPALFTAFKNIDDKLAHLTEELKSKKLNITVPEHTELAPVAPAPVPAEEPRSNKDT